MRSSSHLALLFVAVVLPLSSFTQQPPTSVPNLISYSGTLKSVGGPVASHHTVGVTFAVYKQEDGGAPLWLETQNVSVDSNGHYTVSLGGTDAQGMPADLFSAQEERWLGVKVEGQPEQPRVLLVSVPYALKAREAETLGGLPVSAFVKVDGQQASGNNGSESFNALGSMKAPNDNGNHAPAGGHGTRGVLPVWQTSLLLGNSFVFQTDTGKVGIGTNTPSATLDVNGFINGQYYQIGGQTVLGIGQGFTQENLFIGVGAGAPSYYLARYNTFVGAGAGSNFTLGQNNTFTGSLAGENNVNSIGNTYTGAFAGEYWMGSTGYDTFTGESAGQNSQGDENTFTGFLAGWKTNGNFNTFTGAGVGRNNTGSYNTFAGWDAGVNMLTGNNDIYIGHKGPLAGNESNAIRIGGDIGYGFAQTATYIEGIFGAATSSGSVVFIDSTGKLGTTGGASGTVTSFNGRVGAVVSAVGDYSFGLLTGTLGDKQLGGTYGTAVTLSNNSNVFHGDGSHLTGVVTSFNGRSGTIVPAVGDYSFGLLTGTLGDKQLGGTYGTAVTLSNSSNAFYGDGSHLTGVVSQPGPGSPYYIQNGTTQQPGDASFNINGNGTAGGTLSANAFNSATSYKIASLDVLNTGNGSVFLGFGAGHGGISNTFSGEKAGHGNTGSNNTFTGYQAGFSNQGAANTFTGAEAGLSTTTGSSNTFSGYYAGHQNTTGDHNTFSGHAAGYSSYGGAYNFFGGASAGYNNKTGNNNIYISNKGPQSGDESNAIRIGGDAGFGNSQTAAYMEGIYGAATTSGAAVFIDSTGKLGTTGGAGGGVTSFNGRAGAVVPVANDYNFTLLSGTLGSSQLSGTYSSAVTLSSPSNVFYGDGSHLSGVVTSFNGRAGAIVPAAGDYNFALLSGSLGSSQLTGTYGSAVTLSNSSNVFFGDGSHLSGVVSQPGPGSPYYIQNGNAQQSSANFNISGNGTVGGTLSANAINSATNYQIGSSGVMSIGSLADNDLFVGVGAGASNVPGSGKSNTFSGYQAGHSNTSGSGNTFNGVQAGATNTTGGSNTFSGTLAGVSNTGGSHNTFDGHYAGFSNNGGSQNTFLGDSAGFSNEGGFQNTFSGYQAGYFNTASDNTFLGYQAGYSNTSGPGNTFTGVAAGYSSTSGRYNTFDGVSAGYFNTTGIYNVFIGASAGGTNTTGDNDIYIGNPGPAGGMETLTIRIGGDTGYGKTQNATYIEGIFGATASSGVQVYINSDGKLGTQTSSRRFKEQIHDMGDSTNALLKLRPVTFLYKPEYDKGERTLQYGLIAEEVAELYPDLVAYDKDGAPYTVRYQYLATMLLNEMQKQYHRAEAEAKVIMEQQTKLDEMEKRLQRLEALTSASLVASNR